MDLDQTERMRRQVWIHAGRKRIKLVLSWCGPIIYKKLHVSRLYFYENQNFVLIWKIIPLIYLWKIIVKCRKEVIAPSVSHFLSKTLIDLIT
jgi:hypothetical protein